MARLQGIMFGLRAMKVQKLVAGVATEGYLFPCPQLMGFEENQTKVEIPGGDVVCETVTAIKSLKMTVRWPKLDLQMQAMLIGATYTTTGSGSSQVDKLVRRTTDTAPFIRMEGDIANVGADLAGGQYYMKAYKGKIVGTPKWSNETEKEATIEAEMEFYEDDDGNFYDMELRATRIALSETVDTTPPTISSVVPADNATAVVVTDNIVITFSEAVILNPDNYALQKIITTTSLAEQEFVAGIDGTGLIVTLNPTTSLAAASIYNVRISGVQDLAGNELAAVTNSQFTTA